MLYELVTKLVTVSSGLLECESNLKCWTILNHLGFG